MLYFALLLTEVSFMIFLSRRNVDVPASDLVLNLHEMTRTFCEPGNTTVEFVC